MAELLASVSEAEEKLLEFEALEVVFDFESHCEPEASSDIKQKNVRVLLLFLSHSGVQLALL